MTTKSVAIVRPIVLPIDLGGMGGSNGAGMFMWSSMRSRPVRRQSGVSLIPSWGTSGNLK
jgi:hypothetical protein